ncbi:MAG: tetratricopeptide repeat protein, partial [Bacteroidota bacterium]
VEKYGMLHELTKETWLEGRGAPMSHADEARQLEEEAWPFKRPLFKPALIPTYPQGVELFWAEASNFIAYVAFISREASFVKVSVSASKEEHVPDEVALKELLATMSFLPELPQLTHDPYTEADRLMLLERDHEMALEYYKRVPADHPEYVKARRIIGYSILGNSMGKWDEAVPYVEEAYKLAPDDPKVAEDIGRVYLKVGREEEGIALLKQAGTPRANQVLESLGN